MDIPSITVWLLIVERGFLFGIDGIIAEIAVLYFAVVVNEIV